ncbi:MAG: tRNA (guanosine(37)-N1)-methyltransferase TrmD [Candidatus Methylopumilus sp.]|nr:tRNA (guanosine(37)-N1)-methyltransferase TrmD [Candidatus Methylopumilus sp.]
MRIDLVTLFPEMFSVVRDLGVTGRAHGNQLWSLHTHSPREYTEDVHRTVDDRPYGGGPGMVMMAEPLTRALSAIRTQRATLAQATQEQATQYRATPDRVAQEQSTQDRATQEQAPVVLLSPIGKPFDQAQAQRLAQSAGAIFICGRYEGVDQRFIDQHVDEQWSLGDFVLSGGEIAALAMIDAAVRLLPGALNHGQSSAQDSFQESLSGLLDSPHYTRPENLNGQTVPAVLLSGNHAHIARWRREQSLAITLTNRPDLIDQARARGLLTVADERYLLTLTRS